MGLGQGQDSVWARARTPYGQGQDSVWARARTPYGLGPGLGMG